GFDVTLRPQPLLLVGGSAYPVLAREFPVLPLEPAPRLRHLLVGERSQQGRRIAVPLQHERTRLGPHAVERPRDVLRLRAAPDARFERFEQLGVAVELGRAMPGMQTREARAKRTLLLSVQI